MVATTSATSPEMQQRTIYAHSHGWLVLLHTTTTQGGDQEYECSLYNPFTIEKIQLPNLPPTNCWDFSNCALSSDPKVEGSIVMFIDQWSHDEPQFLSCKLGDVGWMESVMASDCVSCGYPTCGYQAIGSLNGEFYVLTDCCIGLLKVQFDEAKEIGDDRISGTSLLDMKVRRPDRPRIHFLRDTAVGTSFLVQLFSRPNELMIVEVVYGDRITDEGGIKDIGFKGVEFYMANFQQGRWEDLGDLPDDCAIFLGSHPDNIIVYNIPKEDLDSEIICGNTVYFTQYRESNHLYAYDVRDKSISVWSHWPNMKRDCSEPQWILSPRRQIINRSSNNNGTAKEKEKEVTLLLLEDGSSSTNARNPWCDIQVELLCDIQSRLFIANIDYFKIKKIKY